MFFYSLLLSLLPYMDLGWIQHHITPAHFRYVFRRFIPVLISCVRNYSKTGRNILCFVSLFFSRRKIKKVIQLWFPCIRLVLTLHTCDPINGGQHRLLRTYPKICFRCKSFIGPISMGVRFWCDSGSKGGLGEGAGTAAADGLSGRDSSGIKTST